VQNYLRGNTDRQQFENDKQNVDVSSPLENVLPTPMEWSCFLAFVFSLLSCFPSLRIVCFFPFS